MIKVLEIVMVNLGFTSEAASQIINFYKTIAIKFIKELSWFFIQVIHEVVTTFFASWFYVLVTRSH